MQTEQVNDVLVVTLPSRLDASGLTTVQDDFASAVAAHGGKVLVDMSRVTFVASLALRMLLLNHKLLLPQGGQIRLCGLQPQIAEIFRKSRFDTLFVIAPDREAGLAGFAH